MLDVKHYLRTATLLRENVPSFDEYPFSLQVVRDFSSMEFHPKVTFIIGENATGKSTLLEALAVKWGFNPEGGTKNFGFSTRASHSCLHEYMRLTKGYKQAEDGFFLRAESFFNVGTAIENLDREPAPGHPIINSYGEVSLHEQSHGEAFFALILHRFGGKGLYILDEPEAALSPRRQMAMLARIHQLVQDDSQFIIATHSPILMAYPDAKIICLGEKGLQEVEYTKTDHYIDARNFLNDHKKMLDILLEED